MRVRVTLSLETDTGPSLTDLQSLFDVYFVGLDDPRSIRVEGMALADMEDQRRAEGYCPDCGRKDGEDFDDDWM